MLAMTKSEAIKRAGSAYRLAQILGLSRQAISKWGDEVPTLREADLRAKRPEWFKKAMP